MNRLRVALRLEVSLQARYRFLHAGIFSGVMWLALLLPLPGEIRSIVEPYVILGDLAIVGFFFIAGAVFFEKGERTLQALVATPLRFGEYLASKLVMLTGLSTLLAVFIATVTHGVAYDLPFLLAGAILGTVLMLLLSFISSMPFKSISDWFMPSVFPLALFNLPIFYYSGVWQAPWFYLIPTQGPLLMLGAAFYQKTPSTWEVVYSVSYPVLFAAGMYWIAKRMFNKHVVARTGGS